MRFGGHETFYVRPGWLTKGIHFVAQEGERPFSDPAAADELGVGRNMAKAIGYWLTATGLATKTDRSAPLELTELGALLYQRDSYLQHSAAWWALHVNLATGDGIWRWFWNDFRPNRFDRLHCQDALVRAIERAGERPPSSKILQREVAVLLQTYRRALPGDTADPEDNLDCPWRQLGLLTLHSDLDQYERRSACGRLPPEALLYALAASHGAEVGPADISFAEALHRPGGPGRLFHLDADGLSEELAGAEAALGSRRITTRLLGGERVVAVASADPLHWLVAYYDRVEKH